MDRVKTYEYSMQNFDQIKNEKYGRNWPVVYVIEDNNEAYIGETSDMYARCHQHYQKHERKKLHVIHMISDDEFNKSATLNLEALLIQYIAADGKFRLQNGNAGLRNHQYYNKEYYEAKFDAIWDELLRKNVTSHSLVDLKNSDLFKYSPYKALTNDQLEVAKAITKEILTSETSCHMVSGDPGSGKTILAIYLVKYLQQMKNMQSDKIGLVVPMTSLRSTVKKVFKSISGLKASMVIGPNDVVKQSYDILIVDEAHRLSRRKNLTSYKSFDDVNKSLGLDLHEGTQLDWIERSAKHVVLFYDGGQSVRPADIPRERFENIFSKNYRLYSQMRVQGGTGYIEAIENILNESQRTKVKMESYDLRLYEDVDKMIREIKKLNKRYELCRNVAGFAWDWISRDDPNLRDIKIDGYEYRWNQTNMDWVNSKNAIDEIGCIHGIHGYDLNYTGVIIGPELVYRNGKIEIVPEQYKDKKGKAGIEDYDVLKRYILNIYKVLLTRGIYGTYVYACDSEMRQYLKQFMSFVEGGSGYRSAVGDRSHAAEEENGYE